MGMLILSTSARNGKVTFVEKFGIVDALIISSKFYIDCGNNLDLGRFFATILSHMPRLSATKNDCPSISLK